MSTTNGHAPALPAISPDVAHERGYRRIESERQLSAYTQTLTLKQQQIPGLLIPIYQLGNPVPYEHVLRPDKPRIGYDGKDIKYEWPERVPLCLDVLPRYREALQDTTIPIWITEGAKKADALASAFGPEIVPINIGGVWNWGRKGHDGASHPVVDLDKIDWAGRSVELVFDNDVIIKPEVQQALRALARNLKGRGADVHALVLPYSGVKMGVDDALAGGMTTDQLRSFISDLKDIPEVPIAPPTQPAIFKLSDLLKKQFAAVREVIPGILPEGLTLFGGKAKSGKSWTVLDICNAVAAGGYALGKYKVEQGDVLYLALEDNDRRLQNRALKLLEGQQLTYDFDLATEWPRFDEGGIAALEDWLIAHPQRRLVVIDTYIKVRPLRKPGCDIYEEDYKALGGLKALADQYQVAILVTHHQRKASAEDVFDTMMGSGGVTGGVDNLWILARQRGRADAELHVTGRDIEQEQELALQWDGQLARFTVLGDAAEYRMSLERESVLAEVRAAGADGIGPKEVAEALGESYNTIKQRMYQMSKDGTLQLANRGRYIVGMKPHTMPNLTNYPNLTNHPNLANFEDEKVSAPELSGEKVSDDTAMPNLLPNFEIALQSHKNTEVSKVSKGSSVSETPPKNKPSHAARLIVDRYVALAQTGNPEALTKARDYMAANAGDWSEQLDRIEQLAAGVTS